MTTKKFKSSINDLKQSWSLIMADFRALSPKPTTKRQRITGIPHFWQKLAALTGLVALSPLLLVVSLAIHCDSPGGVIYRQNRVGRNGRVFKMYKFRSMDSRVAAAAASDREGICSKNFKDPRITGVGRIIRKLSIDELPQLWNVVIGDMALIGPRPALISEVEEYDYTMLDRFNVMPGLTGLWQVSGRADTTFEEQIQLDSDYVERQSFWLDITILAKTVPAVAFGKGAY